MWYIMRMHATPNPKTPPLPKQAPVTIWLTWNTEELKDVPVPGLIKQTHLKLIEKDDEAYYTNTSRLSFKEIAKPEAFNIVISDGEQAISSPLASLTETTVIEAYKIRIGVSRA